jgi:hypothetical protein
MIAMIIARFCMLIEQFLNLFRCRSVRAFQEVAVYVGCGAGSCVACSACDRYQRYACCGCQNKKAYRNGRLFVLDMIGLLVIHKRITAILISQIICGIPLAHKFGRTNTNSTGVVTIISPTVGILKFNT